MLGVCYYPEHWPQSRWAEDAQLMRDCGLELVRIGEFAWSKIEPQPGTYDWTWLDQAIQTLADAGLSIILGTPTATPPAWLTQRYPDVLRVGDDGRRWSHGGRRHTCPTSSTYRELCRNVVAALAVRYGAHPAVVAWQIDNELGNHHTARCACSSCRAAFHEWCGQRYGTLDRLNEVWGTVFWSQQYSDWSQIPLPSDPVGGGHNPSLCLAYRRFASDAHVDFLREQTTVLRRHSPGRKLTTNIAPLDDEIDWFDIAAEVDVISWDNYPHGFEHPADVAFFHDLVRGFKRQSFWVTEQQAGRINWTLFNPPVSPGQVRLWTYQALAHGAEHLLYFRWRASRYGQEQYHSGLLDHDASPAPGYHEAQQVAQELEANGVPQRAPAEVALLVDYNDAWAVEIERHNILFDYWGMARAIYRDFWHHGIDVDIVRRGSDISQYRHVVVVAPILSDPSESERWRAFVEMGGTLTLTARSCVKDGENVWIDRPAPDGLTGLLDAKVGQWYSLPPATMARFQTTAGAMVESAVWVEDLEGEAAPTLAYEPGSIPGIPALNAAVERRIGAGTVRYVGLYPSQPETGIFSQAEHALPPLVERITLEEGALLLNHAPTEQCVNTPDGDHILPSLNVMHHGGCPLGAETRSAR
jgi:beta-galactosidase